MKQKTPTHLTPRFIKDMILYQQMESQLLLSRLQLKFYKLALQHATGNFPVPLDRDVDLPQWIPEKGQRKNDAKKTYVKSRPPKEIKRAVGQMRHLIFVLEDDIKRLEALFDQHRWQLDKALEKANRYSWTSG